MNCSYRCFFPILIIILSSCSFLPESTPTALAEETAWSSPTAVLTATWQSPEPTPVPQRQVRLCIWIPPSLSPITNQSAGELFQNRLSEFQSRNRDITLEIRVKAIQGVGGLLDSLTSASAAAPDALPDLVALPRDLLEAAALKGLLIPLDDLTNALNEADWFPYALEMANLQDNIYGFPFVGDTLVQVYHTESITNPLTSWSAVLNSTSTLIFNAAGEDALFTLAQYQANDNPVQDDQGRPYLNVEELAEVLSFYQTAAQTGIMPGELLASLQNYDLVWQVFSENRADAAITWASRYLQNRNEGIAVAQIPTMGGQSFTLATGWSLALVGRREESRRAAINLAEFLTDSHFLADWSYAAGYLPTRPSSLELWPDAAVKEDIRKIATASRLQPSIDIRASLEPPLQHAVLSAISGQATPLSAAQTAGASLMTP